MLQLLDTLLFQFVLIIVLWKFKSFVLFPAKDQRLSLWDTMRYMFIIIIDKRKRCVYFVLKIWVLFVMVSWVVPPTNLSMRRKQFLIKYKY